MRGGYPNGPQGAMPQMQGRQNAPSQGGPRGPPNAGRQGQRSGPNARSNDAPAQNGPTITAAALASAGPAEQKQMLGEALYPRIHETVPEMAGKVSRIHKSFAEPR